MQTKERRIGDSTYYVTQFGTLKALEVWTRLFNLLGAGIAKLMAAGDDKERAMASLLQDLAGKISVDDLTYLVETFGEVTTVKTPKTKGPRPLDQDFRETHFMGKLPELFKWLAFGIEVNYSGFLGGLRLKADPSPESPEPPPSQNT